MVVARWLASRPLENLCGAKNSRMGTLKGDFGNVFENLGVVFYSTEMFSEMVLNKWSWKGEKGVGGFTKDIGDH
jgi:hypothetical protein